MAKISGLPPANPLDGSETIPVVQEGESRQAILSAYLEEAINPFVLAAQLAAAFAEEFSGPAYTTVEDGEAATTAGQFFRVPIPATNPVEYTRYQRTAAGSLEAAPLATTAAVEAWLAAKVEYPRSSEELAVGIVPANVLEEYSNIMRYGSEDDANAAINRRYEALYGIRGGALPNSVHPLGNPYFNFAGRGRISLGRGAHDVTGETIILERMLGGIVEGEGCIATTLEDNRANGATFQMNIYRSAIFRDFAMVNKAEAPGTSIGILGVGDNGGQNLGVDNMEFIGYHAPVQVGGGVVGNGDTSLFTRVAANQTNDYLFKIVDPSRQSIIHTFIQPVSNVKEATFYTDAGAEIAVFNGNVVSGESVIEIAANGGANNCRFMIYSLKAEYGYGPAFTGAMRLVDSSANTTNFGRGCLFDFQSVSFEGGQYQPADRDAHRIMDLGRLATVLRARGGKIPGKIRYDSGGSVDLTKTNWSFRDMERSPTPDVVNGQMPWIEWEGNQDRPDQYRGGDRGNRSGKPEFIQYWRNTTTTFIHTGLAGQNNTGGQFGARYGYVAKISTGLAPGAEILELGAKITSYSGVADTKLELLDSAEAADPENSNPAVLFTTTIPSNYKKRWLAKVDISGGAYDLPEPAVVDANGDIYIRITVSGQNYLRVGALAYVYNPVTFT